MDDTLGADINTIAQIAAVPTILDVVCRATGMGFAAVARVTDERWVACGVLDNIQFGLQPGGELAVETTICHEVRQARQPVIINHVADDPHFRHHATPAMYGFQSYISMPIVLADGTFFGTLCAIDPEPHVLNTPTVIGMFTLFAELIAFHLDAHDRISRSEAQLSNERAVAHVREEFIAVLGHDLRNPLAAIDSGARMLLRRPLDEKAAGILRMMQDSITRMSGLIDDVLDFARGRLGGGIPVERAADLALVPVLQQVVAEFALEGSSPQIDAAFSVTEQVECDPGRIGQMLSNLIGNALMHGAAGTPVVVRAATYDGVFELSVANSGEPIPPETIKNLFQPFFRGAVRPSQQGLGLGLYIASEIARAHGGDLQVRSTALETRFTFRMAQRHR